MFQIIKQDIFKYVEIYIGKGSIYAVLAFFLTLILYNFFLKQSGRNYCSIVIIITKSLVMSFLVLYVYIVIGITLLSRTQHSEIYINLQLFSTFDKTLLEPKYIYENIVMLIPFAIILYFLATPFRNMYISLLTGFFCSLAIEVVQLITKLGFFIVDDILTNTLGMLIGYTFCSVMEWLYKVCIKVWKGQSKLCIKE